mgnify:CR=1 FL=1
MVKRHGLETSNLDSFIFKICINDSESHRKHIDVLRKVIELSKRFNLKYTRVFTFWWQRELSNYLNQLIERFQPIIKLAEREGFHLIVENEYSCIVGIGREAREIC